MEKSLTDAIAEINLLGEENNIHQINKLGKQMEEIVRDGLVPTIIDGEERELDSTDFEDAKMKAVSALASILKTYKSLKVGTKDNDLEKVWIKTNVSTILLIGQHISSDNIWSTSQSTQLACDVLLEVLSANKCQNIDQLCSEDFSKKIFMKMQPFLTLNNWRQNPGMKAAFSWILFNTKFPNVSNVLNEVLPISLLFMDDYRLENKILGVKCIHHIINNVTQTELVRVGWNDVIYSALDKLSYTNEPSLLEVIHPCLIEAAKLKKQPDTKINQLEENYYRILVSMDGEQRIALRETYSKIMQMYINELKTNNIRWLKRSLEVISTYLEIYEGPEEISRRNALTALKSLIKLAWPRIPKHMECIIKMLIKFLYDIQEENIATSNEVRLELQEEAVLCLILLKKIDSDKFMNIWTPVTKISSKISDVMLRISETSIE